MADRARKTAGKAAPKQAAAAEPKPPAAAEVCPRCGTEKFGAEERTRVEGQRTVRDTVLVCERGHTFARPAGRSAG